MLSMLTLQHGANNLDLLLNSGTLALTQTALKLIGRLELALGPLVKCDLLFLYPYIICAVRGWVSPVCRPPGWLLSLCEPFVDSVSFLLVSLTALDPTIIPPLLS